ncbi:MAG: LysE family translocator [Desulfurococcales archaeon]|nr:LysE family translocator [Desulfurococcales archaeon]
MRELKKIATLSVAISPSGALSPGPLSAMAVTAGLTLGALGGLLLALGHMMVELPYILLLYISVEKARKYLEKIKIPMNLIVSAFLIYFSYLLFKTSMQQNLLDINAHQASVSTIEAISFGAILTGLNPYFLMWWVTVGYPLVNEASKNGTKGLAAMYGSHIWMDYAWLTFLAAAGGLASGISLVVYRGLMLALAIVLLYFAARTLVDVYKAK